MLFSVTIPAYKAKYLKECIDSILAQTYSDFELIIVNDASPEDLDSIVSSYSDSRIRYYINEKNCGAVNVVDNWNKCLEYAKGEYIICMGDDDRLLPNCLEEYVKLMEKYPGLGVYHAWTEIIDGDGNLYKLQHPRPEYESALSLIWNRWNGRSTQFIGDFCFERETLNNSGGFYFLPLAWASDDITAAIAADKNGIANTQTICFQYRENLRTITNSGDWKTKIVATIQEEVWYRDYFHQKREESLNAMDRKYLKLLEEQLVERFYDKYKWEMKKGVSSNSISLNYMMKNHCVCHLKKLDVLLYWIKAKLRR